MFTILFVLMIPLAAISLAVYSSVLAMSQPGQRLSPATRGQHYAQFDAAQAHHAWAQSQGFEWVGGYIFQGVQPIFVAAWKHAAQGSFFCMYMHQARQMYDFVTLFEGKRGLTTTSTADGLLLPHPPGACVQGFKLEPDDLWAKHLEAEVYLASRGFVPLTAAPPFEQAVQEAIDRQMAYVRTRPLWPVQGVYWFILRRHLLFNRSIESQHHAGLIRLG